MIFLGFCALLGLHVLNAQETCKTPLDLDGQCIPIEDCEKLRPLVQESAEQREYLKLWHCGYHKNIPKVCCPNKPSNDKCTTFTGQPGTCTTINDCPTIRKKLEKKPVSAANLEYVQRSKCSRNSEKFCCEAPDIITKTGEGDSLLPDRQQKQCGVGSGSSNKIIGGVATSIDAYPWLGIIEYTESGRPYLCSGSLINDLYVLTAAHCLVTSNNVSLGAQSVRFGDYNITNDGPDCTDTDGGGRDCTTGDLSIKIESIIVHPEYSNSKTLLNVHDIALIRLMEPAPYTDFIRPICLPETDITDTTSSNVTFVIAGWGYINDSHTSDVKLDANIDLVDRETCLNKYKIKDQVVLGSGQICAGGGEKDACRGDSGGPLSYNDDKVQELVGVISFGPRQCATLDRPSVYTKVYEYIPWITNNIKP